MSLLGTKEKNFSFHFRCYNLTICAANFFEAFCTCSHSSLPIYYSYNVQILLYTLPCILAIYYLMYYPYVANILHNVDFFGKLLLLSSMGETFATNTQKKLDHK
jgi:hypothetical protein